MKDVDFLARRLYTEYRDLWIRDRLSWDEIGAVHQEAWRCVARVYVNVLVKTLKDMVHEP